MNIIPKVPSFGEEFARSVGQGLSQGASSAMNSYTKKKELEKENAAIMAETGVNLAGITDPDQRKYVFSEQIKAKQDKAKKTNESLADKAGYDTIKDRFGEKAADLWQISNPGVRTKLINDLLSEEEDVNELPEKETKKPIQKVKSLDAELVSEDPIIKEPKVVKEPKISKSKAIAPTKQDIEYNQELNSKKKTSILTDRITKRAETLINRGASGKTGENILEKVGLGNFTSADRRELASLQKELVAPTLKKTLGGNFTASEFNTILNASFSPNHSKEANLAILNNINAAEEIAKKEIEISNRIKKENGGNVPFDYESRVADELMQFAHTKLDEVKNNTKLLINEENGIPPGKTLMYDPQGNKLSVPDNEAAIKYYTDLGATLP